MALAHSRRKRKVLIAAAVVGVVVAALAGIAGYVYTKYSVVRYSADHGRLTVEAEKIGALGTVLVTNKGFALYTFPPDGASQVTCTDDCAFAWPPLKMPEGGRVVAGKGVRADMLGSVPNPDGGRVVTYHGWPLYTYLGDADPGRAKGQSVDADGGYWFVIRPTGEIVGW